MSLNLGLPGVNHSKEQTVHKRGEEGNAGGVKWVETSARSDL